MIIDTSVEQIQHSFSLVKKWCRAINIAFIVIAVFVALIGAITVASIVFDAGGISAATVGVFAYTVLRDGIIVASLALAAVVFHDASTSTTPFGAKQTGRLRIIGLLLVALIIVELLFEVSFAGTVTVMGVQLEVTAESTHSLDMPALVMAALAFCMSVIFQYGLLLQGSHDETV